MRIDIYLDMYKYLKKAKYNKEIADGIEIYQFELDIPFSCLISKDGEIICGFNEKHGYLNKSEINKIIYDKFEIYYITEKSIYWGSVEWSEEDSCFFGKIKYRKQEEVKDLITYEGKTIEELEEDFKRAVEEYECLELTK